MLILTRHKVWLHKKAPNLGGQRLRTESGDSRRGTNRLALINTWTSPLWFINYESMKDILKENRDVLNHIRQKTQSAIHDLGEISKFKWNQGSTDRHVRGPTGFGPWIPEWNNIFCIKLSERNISLLKNWNLREQLSTSLKSYIVLSILSSITGRQTNETQQPTASSAGPPSSNNPNLRRRNSSIHFFTAGLA